MDDESPTKPTANPTETLQLLKPDNEQSKSRLLGLTISAQAQTQIRRLPKTLGLVSVWITMGMVMAAQSVTLPDMLPRIDANYETIAWAIALGSLTCIVLIPFGVFCDRYYKSVNLVMCVSLMMISVACAALPWSRSLGQFCLINTVIVFSHTIQNPIGNFMMATLWKEDASCPLHMMHLGWGVGAFVAPILFRPFLSPDHEKLDKMLSGTVTVGVFDLPGNTTLLVDGSQIKSTIEVPYSILSGINVICAILFLGFHFLGSEMQLNYEHTSRTFKETILDFCHPRKWAYGSASYGTVILIGMIAYYTGLEALGTPFHLFLFSFAVESEFKFPKQEAAVLEAVFDLMYSVGRIVFGILTIFLPLEVLLFTELTGVLIVLVCMSLFLYSKYHLWFYVCIYAFLCGPLWPGGLSWSNKYILFTATFATWIHVAPQLMSMGSKWLVGYLFEYIGPMYALYFGLGSGIFVCSTMIVLQLFVWLRQRRKDKE